MPPTNEFTITAPLPEADLRQLIHKVEDLQCSLTITLLTNVLLGLRR